jgi:hypothetical protein
MVSIFSNLPDDIKKHILSFDNHFKIRRGQIVSVIPKDDFRYKLLEYITIRLTKVTRIFSNKFDYDYNFPNLFDIEDRKKQFIDDDMCQITIFYHENIITYRIFIGRLKPKETSRENTNKLQIFHKGNLIDYEWYYIEYYYSRV